MKRTNNRRQYIIPPKDGWKASAYYVVEVSVRANNPIFMDIFYSGFLDKGKPGSYAKFFMAETPLGDIKYLRVISEINSDIDNEHSLPMEVMKSKYPELMLKANNDNL